MRRSQLTLQAPKPSDIDGCDFDCLQGQITVYVRNMKFSSLAIFVVQLSTRSCISLICSL